MDLIFHIAVTMLYDVADWSGLTYKQVNVIIFCMLWPAATIALIVMLNQQRKIIVHLKRQLNCIDTVDPAK